MRHTSANNRNVLNRQHDLKEGKERTKEVQKPLQECFTTKLMGDGATIMMVNQRKNPR